MPQLPLTEAFNLALRHHQSGDLSQAEPLYRQILAQNPAHADTLHMLGLLLFQRRDFRAAVSLIQQSITLSPNAPEARSNLALALLSNRQIPEAIASAQTALTLRPNYPEALNNLGAALLEAREFGAAIESLQKAITLRPAYAQAHLNLGNAHKAHGDLDAALAAYRNAIAAAPTYAEAHANLGTALKDTADLDAALAALRRAHALAPGNPAIHSNLLYALHFHPDSTPASLAAEHKIWNQRHALPLRPTSAPQIIDPSPTRRLKIGYISPDLGFHPVGRFLFPLLAHHNHADFEIFAYSDNPASDALTQKLRAHADHWHDISAFSDPQAADLIRTHKIDILIDLTMHMAHNRLLLFARKAAPLQLTYLAYCSTTGLTAIDYRFSDPHLDPDPVDQTIYSEETLRLPHTYWCYHIENAPEIGPLPALKNNFITFACLNNFCKVTPPTLALWSTILRAVPNSQLLLFAAQGAHRQRFANFLQASGIDPGRLRFTANLPFSDYLNLYNQTDIALDPFPAAGGTTSCDALYMGVPLVTLPGQTAVSRSGASILANLNLTEFIAPTPEEYAHLAERLATDIPRLTTLRSTLRRCMQQSPLMNAPAFLGHLQKIYRQIWTQIWTQCCTA